MILHCPMTPAIVRCLRRLRDDDDSKFIREVQRKYSDDRVIVALKSNN